MIVWADIGSISWCGRASKMPRSPGSLTDSPAAPIGRAEDLERSDDRVTGGRVWPGFSDAWHHLRGVRTRPLATLARAAQDLIPEAAAALRREACALAPCPAL